MDENVLAAQFLTTVEQLVQKFSLKLNKPGDIDEMRSNAQLAMLDAIRNDKPEHNDLRGQVYWKVLWACKSTIQQCNQTKRVHKLKTIPLIEDRTKDDLEKNPQDIAELKEIVETSFKRAIRSLDIQVFIMRYRHEMTIGEIGKRLSLDRSWINKLLQRSYNRLRGKNWDRSRFIKAVPFKRICLVPDCERKYYCSGMCAYHYQRYQWKTAPTCTLPGCDLPVYVKDICMKHYHEQRKPQRSARKALALVACLLLTTIPVYGSVLSFNSIDGAPITVTPGGTFSVNVTSQTPPTTGIAYVALASASDVFTLIGRDVTDSPFTVLDVPDGDTEDHLGVLGVAAVLAPNNGADLGADTEGFNALVGGTQHVAKLTFRVASDAPLGTYMIQPFDDIIDGGWYGGAPDFPQSFYDTLSGPSIDVVVPEPATLAVCGFGIVIGLALRRGRSI